VLRAVAAGARVHDAGPSSVRGRPIASGSENHGTALHSHGLNSASVPPVSAGFGTPSHFHDGSDCMPVATTGSYCSAWTVGASCTGEIVPPDGGLPSRSGTVAISTRFGLALALSFASVVNAA